MTIYVDGVTETIASNNTLINGVVEFVLTSGYSKTDTVLPAQITFQNSRYTQLVLTFPSTFKDEHKNGIYYYTIRNADEDFEKGYCKIITEPGGGNGAIAYNSGVVTEERQSDTFFRPNY